MKKNKLILDQDEIISVLGNKYKDLSLIVNDKFGIVNAILERYELKKFDLYMYQCLSANAKVLFNLDREVSSGGLGVSSVQKDAMIGCLAEALERYSMSFVPKDEVVFCHLSDLDKKRTFSKFYTYDLIQYNRYDSLFANPEKDKIHWTKIYLYNDIKKWKYWPSSLIYLPFNYSKPVSESTSTGMAAGYSYEDCILSGLLELLERDALMINFLQRLNPPEIDISTINGKNKKFISKILEEYQIKIYKLYTDIDVPIYLSIIWKKVMGKIHYGIGACASLNSDEAINKSLRECLFTFFYSKNIMGFKKDNPNDITALYEHFLYYQGDNFSKLLFDSKKIKYCKETTTMSRILISLKKGGIDVYYKELTTSDISSTKIRVFKVIAPGLIDLNKSHILPRLGADRLWEVPKKLSLDYGEEISSLPHPFP